MYLLVIGLCATKLPDVDDCHLSYAAPVQAASLEECQVRAQLMIRSRFRGVPELGLPVVGYTCNPMGVPS